MLPLHKLNPNVYIRTCSLRAEILTGTKCRRRCLLGCLPAPVGIREGDLQPTLTGAGAALAPAVPLLLIFESIEKQEQHSALLKMRGEIRKGESAKAQELQITQNKIYR